MCDLRIASEVASFSESFTRLGLIPGDGGAWFLTRAVGHSKASEMILTCKTYTAQEALQMGLIHEVCASEELLQRTQALVERVASFPPIAVQLAKRALVQAYESSLEVHLEVAASLQAITQTSSDHQVAVRAILDKRQGLYTNS
jgi:enoyl-CoA hydratase/carnithine racemase